MQTEAPVIQLQITATPTLSQERLKRLFEIAEQQGVSPEAFVERAISRALEIPMLSPAPAAPAMAS